VTRWFVLSVAELTDGNSLQESKSDIAFCDPFKGLIQWWFTCSALVYVNRCRCIAVFARLTVISLCVMLIYRKSFVACVVCAVPGGWLAACY